MEEPIGELSLFQMKLEVAACGLTCESCDMLLATEDNALAQKIVDWFKEELGEDVDPGDIHCGGCLGDRKIHWSPDCWIMLCCVDAKGLEHCYECGDFPCEKLEEWAAQNDRYGEALQRLREFEQP